MTSTTISEGTRHQYERRARQLHSCVGRLLNKRPCELLPMEVVEYVLGRAEVFEGDGKAVTSRATVARLTRIDNPRGKSLGSTPHTVISKATFRIYKAALLWHFKEAMETVETRLDLQYLQAAVARLESTPQTSFSKRGSHTSSLKLKKFPDADFRALMTALEGSCKANHNAVRMFLLANRLVGLRPSEWEHASVRPAAPGSKSLVLMVRNAKTSNGRGNGDTRTLLLDDLDEDELDALHNMVQLTDAIQQRQVKNARRIVASFPQWLHCVRESMRLVAAEVFPSRTLRPTLYSLRHQVAADAKKAGGSQTEVAALLGHGSDATAGSHYARRISGVRTQRVQASPANVATVHVRSRRRPSAFKPRPWD